MFGLAAIAAVAAMAFVGANSASALVSTQLCKVNTTLVCGAGNAVTEVHQVLKTGTVGKLLASINVLCLEYLVRATPLGLGKPQVVHVLEQKFAACGTGSTHNNCTVSTPAGQDPLFDLLKLGFDEGVLTATSGQTRLQCSNLGLDCLYDVAGMEFEVGGNELKAENTPTTELGGKFLCPNEGLLDAELKTLENAYVLS